ncbi:MAG: hypothetical protein U0R44_02515 [Candidatus Micrarchaeia archaeon]
MDNKGPTVYNDNKTVIDLGGSLSWILCIVLALAIIHFSCGAGTATGYVGDVCARGFGILDYAGLICCAPLYLLIIIVTSGGLRIW